MRRGLVGVAVGVAAGACYSPLVPTGVRCTPEAPSCPTGQMCVASGGEHVCLPGDPSGDAGRDSNPGGDGPGPPAVACPGDSSLLLCYGFDGLTLPSPLTNEGAASVVANLTNVTRIAQGSGGAAQVDTTSTIYVPPNTALPGIRSIDLWLRLEVDPPAGARVGIVDAETITAPLSLFYYRDPNHRIRCQIGTTLYGAFTLPLGTYVHVACVCNAGTLQILVDGVKIAEGSGCTPGDGSQYGVQIGQNGNALMGTAADEWMTGAIDLIRLWNVAI